MAGLNKKVWIPPDLQNNNERIIFFGGLAIMTAVSQPSFFSTFHLPNNSRQ
jgi:hypothetical protein